MTNFLDTIVLQYTTVDRYKLTNVNKYKLIEEIFLDKDERLSDDVNTSLFEDTVWNLREEGQKVIDQVNEAVKDIGMEAKEYWSLIHQPLESTNTHNHPESELAFVYYLKASPKAGNLVFEFENGSGYSIPPVEGDLLIFPAWCKHKVTKNLSEDIRISLAGNIRYI